MESVRVKICGLTTAEDALFAAASGADALGFIFSKKSPRYVTPAVVARITRQLPPFVKTVGVFVNETLDAIKSIVDTARVDCIQLHGDEGPEFVEEVGEATGAPVIKAIRVKGPETLRELQAYEVSAFLLDTYKKGVPGGTGETFDWGLALRAKESGRIILSGGLTPGNVAAAIEQAAPYAVDVSSGVESAPGQKDADKIKRFMDEARKAGRSLPAREKR